MSVEFHRFAVAVSAETEDCVRVSFEVPAALRDRFRHVPGQHLVLRREIEGQDIRRSYSIWNRPGDERPSVAIKRIPGGLFSTWATTALHDGDTLEVMEPLGEFRYQPVASSTGNYVALAAGSGITPVLSILTSVLEVETSSRVMLVYGNRAAATIMFLEELDALKCRFPDRFVLVHVLSREPHEVPLFEGHIDPEKLRRLADTLIDVASVSAWFVCGPLDMVQGVRDTLQELGVADANVHFELFFDQRIERVALAGQPAEGTLRLTLTLDGRTSVVAIDPNGPSLLDSARSVRPETPFGCKGAMCATCKAQILDGTVRMAKNYALSDAELAAGYVLTCQAHAVDVDVTLTFDAGLGSRAGAPPEVTVNKVRD